MPVDPVIDCDDNEEWYGSDRPTEIWPNGTKAWYQHGEIHRDNDQPAGIWPDGTKIWCQHGKLHRIGSPAKNTEYYIDGNKVTKEFHDQVLALYTKHNQYVPGYGWVSRRLTYTLRDTILRYQHPRHMEEALAEIARLLNLD